MGEAAEMTTIENWIAGKKVPSSSGNFLPLVNPATGKQQGRVCLSNDKDVNDAVAAAKAALPGWSKLTIKARCAYLFKFHNLVNQHMQELIDLVVLEHGKNRFEAMGDVAKGNETVEWATSLPQIAQGKLLEVSTGVNCHDVRVPLGVVASIVPFNFPFMVPHWTLPIAIGTGNTFILKPSEKVPMTMARVAQLAKEAGIPDGVINIVNGAVDVVNSICDHPDIAAVTFVGSSKVAQIVQKRCQGSNKRVLALGGAKNHLVALPDCNVDMASSDIVASFTGCAGQRCMAASAFISVTENSDLVAAIVKKASALQPGQEAGQVGPVIDQLALDRIHRYIDEAEKDGCKILLDGRGWSKTKQHGYWIGPTIIVQKSHKDKAFTDEIFGPVLSIVTVATKEEAIAIENGSPYGNAASIYTTVGAHAEWFTSRFQAGMCGVNIGVPVPREPFSFGGWNDSRFGDLDITGEGGMEFFTKRKKITTKWNPPAVRTAGDWMA